MSTPGLTLDDFSARLEQADQDRFDDDDWAFNEGQETAITHDDGGALNHGWAGKWEDGGPDLVNIETPACRGRPV